MDAWKRAQVSLPVGRVIDDKYEVVAVDDRGFTVKRLASGKPLKVSRKMIESAAGRLRTGEKLAKQANQKQGGISYPIAVEAVVVAALGTTVRYDAADRVFVRSRAATSKAG